ncbi:MAG: membrane-bound O-acyltransferase family protein [Planctomycetota bacterium]|nr:MAG: membrane-bound O-acyltransferase family protein [Planctomycetota bacterium]
MIFNSIDFLFFAILFFTLWPFLKFKNNLRWSYLVSASFIFYGWWDYRFLALIILSGLIDFICGLCIDKYQNKKKYFLYLSIIGNIGTLAFFKYINFAIDTSNDILSFLNYSNTIPTFDIILPIGISFYTFQSMSYTIDIYRNQLKPTKNIFHFFAYLSMFPQLVAGPIVRAKDLLVQLEKFPEESWDDKWEGSLKILKGLFKKMVIADNLGPLVNAAFSNSVLNHDPYFWWLIMILFAIQIYCDFSGYSDIAEGLARWMGYRFPKNFDHPYVSISLKEFWSRWHISLSTWFRDYIYIPLGGNKKGTTFIILNIYITMLLSGLWHGAAWNFIIWSFLHASFLIIERFTKWPEKFSKSKILMFFAWTIIMTQVLIAWVFFRANSFEQACNIVCIMLTPSLDITEIISYIKTQYKPIVFALLILIWHIIWYKKWNNLAIINKYKVIWQPITFATIVITIILFRGQGNAFIYFQF